jgi:hypothetical protein
MKTKREKGEKVTRERILEDRSLCVRAWQDEEGTIGLSMLVHGE